MNVETVSPLVVSTACRSNTGEVACTVAGAGVEVGVTETSTVEGTTPGAKETVALPSLLVATPPPPGVTSEPELDGGASPLPVPVVGSGAASVVCDPLLVSVAGVELSVVEDGLGSPPLSVVLRPALVDASWFSTLEPLLVTLVLVDGGSLLVTEGVGRSDDVDGVVAATVPESPVVVVTVVTVVVVESGAVIGGASGEPTSATVCGGVELVTGGDGAAEDDVACGPDEVVVAAGGSSKN